MNPLFLLNVPGPTEWIFILILLFMLPWFILRVIAHWIIYQKAGYEGWESLIPFYNIYILLKIVGKPGWWLILFLIPLVNVVYLIWVTNMLSKSFGKDEGFTIGLLLIGSIFYPILAFSRAEYQGPYGERAAFETFQASRQTGFDFESKAHR